MKSLFVLLFILMFMHSFSQDSLKGFNYRRNRIAISGMKILGSWGIANIGVGTTGWANAHGADKYFYRMNTLWGIVNTSLATIGIIGSEKKILQQLDASENMKAQQRIEKVFLINAGLDVVYSGAGLYLKNRGNNHNNAQLKGFGASVVMQGIFLFLFDGIMYKIQKTNGKKFNYNSKL